MADEDTGPDHLTLWLSDTEAIQLFEAVEPRSATTSARCGRRKRLFDAAKHLHEDDLDPGWDPEDPRSPGLPRPDGRHLGRTRGQVIAARLLCAAGAACLLAGAPVGFAYYDWRVGGAWLVVGAFLALLGLDVDKVTRESRWQARDAQRDWRRLREARTRQRATREAACG